MFCADRVGGHLAEVVDRRAQNFAGFFNQAARAREIAGVMIGDGQAVIGRFIELQPLLANEAGRQFADVFRARGFQKIQRSVERVHEGLRRPPGVPAFADDEPFDAQVAGGVHQAAIDFLELIVIEEQTEIARFAGVGARCPTDAGGMEQFRVAHHRVRVGEQIRRGRHEQDLGAFSWLTGILMSDAGFLLQFLFEKLATIAPGRFRNADIVADLVGLLDDLRRRIWARRRWTP